MNKNTKMIVGVGALAIVGYLVWKQMSPKAAFANLTAPGGRCPAGWYCNDIFCNKCISKRDGTWMPSIPKI